MDPLRYGPKQVPLAGNPDELGFLRLRFKRPEQARSELLEQPILMADAIQSLNATSDDYRFTAAVGAFGQRLRGGKYLEGYGYDDIVELARGARGQDSQGTRADLLRVVRLAASLDHQPVVSAVR